MSVQGSKFDVQGSTVRPGTQRKLVLDDSPTLALATIATVREQLPGHDEDDITALIEEGFLLYAWNIGLGQAKETRILPACVLHYKRTLGSKPMPDTDAQVWTQLVHALRLGDKPFVLGTSLRILLNCSSTHIINLIEAKELKVQPGTTWQTGPNGSPVVSLASFKQFLTARRLT